MKIGLKTGLALGAALACVSNVMASPLEIDYANTTGSFITFNGNSTFDFTPSANSFKVTSGTAAGLNGEISGIYTIGTVVAGDAPVTGTGTFTINDGATPLTATATWVDLYTFLAIGGLNSAGTVDLTGISYAGSNPDLQALAANGSGINVLTFQFGVATSTATLKSHFTQTSFSGSITTPVPDGGTTVALMGGALLALGGLRRKISR